MKEGAWSVWRNWKSAYANGLQKTGGWREGELGITRRQWVGLKRIVTLDKLTVRVYETSNIHVWLYSTYEVE